MAKTKISEFSATPANNTDIDSINIAEGCAPSGINDAIRELMAQLKDWQSGTSNDPYVVGSSGSLTLNQGTANGVAYLNGSKVVTSGSALTFDGTNLGIGASSPLKPLDITFAGTSGARRFLVSYDDSVITIKGANASNDPEAIRITGDNIRFNTGTSGSGSEVGRFTSTGLGIGTSSPAVKLDVNGVGGALSAVNPPLQVWDTTALAANIGGGIAFGGNYTGSTKTNWAGIAGLKENGTDNNYSGYMAFYTRTNGSGNAERMRLDSSGNLGLGVTPSAWSNMRAMDIGDGAFSISADGGGTGDGSLTWNGYYNGSNWIYKYTGGVATRYRQSETGHAWFTAPSGTAGNTISFTQAMTLDASGRLAIGVTSVTNGTAFGGSGQVNVATVASSGYPCLQIRTTSGGGSSVQFTNGDTVNAIIGYNASGGTNEFDINNALSGAIKFGTNNTERARIDSGGNLLVGTTSVISAGKYSSSFAGATENGIILQTTLASTGSTYIGFVNSSGSTIGSITQSTSSTVAYNVTSDQRLKENIVDAPDFGSVIDSIQVRSFDWKTDQIHQRAGFIALELLTVAPEAV